jgi:hypothetical protein
MSKKRQETPSEKKKKKNESKEGWRCGPSDRELASQTQGSQFKSRTRKK